MKREEARLVLIVSAESQHAISWKGKSASLHIINMQCSKEVCETCNLPLLSPDEGAGVNAVHPATAILNCAVFREAKVYKTSDESTTPFLTPLSLTDFFLFLF